MPHALPRPGARRDHRVAPRGPAQPASSRASSSAVSGRSAAAAESAIDAGRLAPGIGMTTSACARCQARQTCCGETPRSRATSANAACSSPSAAALPIPPSGDQGRNAIPCRAQCSSSARDERNARRELVLHRRQLGGRAGQLDLVDVGVADADADDLALGAQLLQRADRLRVRHRRVGPVELVEPDRLDAERPQRRLAGRPQVLRAAVQRPRAVRRPGVAALGGDDDGRGRRPTTRSARATSRSLWPTSSAPRQYASAVSMRVTPASRAACTVATACASSGRPSTDRGMAPRPIAPTVRSASRRCCTGSSWVGCCHRLPRGLGSGSPPVSVADADRRFAWRTRSAVWWRRGRARPSRSRRSSSPTRGRARRWSGCRRAGCATPTCTTARAASTTTSRSCSATRPRAWWRPSART